MFFVTLHPTLSVHPLVGWSACWSHFYFFMNFFFLAVLLVPISLACLLHLFCPYQSLSVPVSLAPALTALAVALASVLPLLPIDFLICSFFIAYLKMNVFILLFAKLLLSLFFFFFWLWLLASVLPLGCLQLRL